MSRVLYHWDSVNFAHALDRFDLLAEHPQPPGYILYVWLVRAVRLVEPDANAALVLVSTGASALAVGMLYLLGRRMWGHRAGLLAALFLAASPLFWFYGAIALPHALDSFLVVLAAWCLYRLRAGESEILYPSVAVLAIAGGVRQQTLVFLLPLTLYAVWALPWRRLAAAGALGVGLCAGWLLPMAANAGGLGAYLEKVATFGARFQAGTSVLAGAGWAGILYNLGKLIPYTLYAAWPMMVAVGLAVVCWRQRPRVGRSLPFLALWAIPSVLFYTFIHMGQQGLVLVFLPVLALAGGRALDRLADHPQLRATGILPLSGLLVVSGALIFLLAPEFPLGAQGPRLLTLATIRRSDRDHLTRIEAIERAWAPGQVLVLAQQAAHAEYYLPEHQVLECEASSGSFAHCRPVYGRVAEALPAEFWVLYDPELTFASAMPVTVEWLYLASGERLEYVRWPLPAAWPTEGAAAVLGTRVRGPNPVIAKGD